LTFPGGGGGYKVVDRDGRFLFALPTVSHRMNNALSRDGSGFLYLGLVATSGLLIYLAISSMIDHSLETRPHASFWSRKTDERGNTKYLAQGYFFINPPRDNESYLSTLCVHSCVSTEGLPVSARRDHPSLFRVSVERENLDDLEVPLELATKDRRIGFVWRIRKTDPILVAGIGE
jgi:hypothetical protein